PTLKRLVETKDDIVGGYLNDIMTIPASLAGLPAISIPSSLSSRSLPLGIQLIGNAFQEEKLFRLAHILESHSKFPHLKITAHFFGKACLALSECRVFILLCEVEFSRLSPGLDTFITVGLPPLPPPADAMSNTLTLQMPRRAQSLVVGKSRQIINDIMAKTGTVIVIPSRKEQSSAVTITGEPESIEEAQEMIERILGYELDDNELTIAYFSIPKKQHSAIIGPEGSILKELRKKCGCHIHV
ncbi:hypothetical protein BVRB_023080, partial [Beta vulgaris subsp. vulgaris]